jgi:hypothetical protein
METRVNVLPTGASAHDTGTLARASLGAAFLAYFAGTALLYFWGPWQFPASGSRSPLILFLVAVHVAFALGYVVGVRGAPVRSRISVSADRVVLVAASIELLLLLPTSYYNTGYWIPRPWAAVENLGAAYSHSLELREHGTPYVNYARMLLAPVLAVTIPLGVFCWRHLSWVTRSVLALAVTGTIVLFVAMGANAGAAQWLALFPWFVLASHLAGIQRLSRRAWSMAAILLLTSGLVFVVFFAASMAQRAGSYAKSGSMDGIGARLASPGDRQNPAGPSRSMLRIGADGLAAYLSQGYHAVYLSLQEPFVPCYGVGNSVFLQRQVTRLSREHAFRRVPLSRQDRTSRLAADGLLGVHLCVDRVRRDICGYRRRHGRRGLACRPRVARLSRGESLRGGTSRTGARAAVLRAGAQQGDAQRRRGHGVRRAPRRMGRGAAGSRCVDVNQPAPTTDPGAPALAFVGILIPDEAQYRGPAFNRAGQMFQKGLVDGLAVAGLPPDIVFSIEPVASFPRTRRLWIAGGRFAVGAGVPVRLLPFVNVHPFKWLTAGLTTFVALARWSWREPASASGSCSSST